ncbi:MAG TPA: ABC transporter substrate-binding protein [Longimicrobiales bacterium]|nr:ABC transporter substrate-binding protein [Longimicrobiales bacterium]
MMTLPRSTTLLPAAVLFLAACGDAPSPRTAAAEGDPFCEDAMARVDAWVEAAAETGLRDEDAAYGGTAVVGHTTELVRGMNALQTVGYYPSQLQRFVNLMTLIQVDGDLEPVPYLAESWTESDDGTSVTFRLRDDVYWHDGERTDAYDVAFTYLRATDTATAFPNAAFFEWYLPGDEGVEVVDSLTVTFRMRPHAEVLDPWRALAIMPEHLLGEVPPEELVEHPFGTRCPVGNGPFVFVSHATDDRWVFEANPGFPAGLGGRPYLDRLVYRVIPEQTTLLTELITGRVDVFVSLRPDQASVVVDNEGTGLRTMAPREFTFVAWNTRRPQLADARVRRALTLGVDRGAVVDALLRGYGSVAQTGIPPYHWAYDPDLPAPAFDPIQARRLLDQAGWRDRDGDGVREGPDGTRLAISVIFNAANQDRRTIAELMQAQLREVGVELTPEPLEAGTMAERVMDPGARDFDGLILAWVPEFRVEESDLFASVRIDEPYAFAGLRDAQVDDLLARLPLATERDQARPLWDRYQRRILDLQPFTYFYYAQRLAGVSDRMTGVEMDYRGELVNVRRWRVRADDR